MALARKCDRCGKLYEYHTKNNAINRLHITMDGLITSKDRSFDLCKECMDEFDIFMNMEETKHD